MCGRVLVSVVSVLTDEIKYPFEIMYVILWFTCKIWIVENQIVHWHLKTLQALGAYRKWTLDIGLCDSLSSGLGSLEGWNPSIYSTSTIGCILSMESRHPKRFMLIHILERRHLMLLEVEFLMKLLYETAVAQGHLFWKRLPEISSFGLCFHL